jgi:2-methylcitrate dehydratase PrpD
MDRVTWEHVADEDLPGGMEVVLEVDGATHHLPAATFRGSPEDPADFADVEAKFRRFTGGLLSPDRQDQVVELVRGLDRLADAAELAAHIGR